MNNKIKKILMMILSIILCINMVACSKTENGKDNKSKKAVETSKNHDNKESDNEIKDIPNTEYPLTIVDDRGRKVVIEKKPERIAAISDMLLAPLYALGGTSIAKTDSMGYGSVKGTEDLPDLGPVFIIDEEKLISLEPDLILAQVYLHDVPAQSFDQYNLKYTMSNVKTLEDCNRNIKMVGQIIDKNKEAAKLIKDMNDKVDELVKKAPKDNKKVALLYTTGQDVQLKLNNTTAGDVCNLLGIENVAQTIVDENNIKVKGEEAPLSLEDLVKHDPEVILINTRVTDMKDAKKAIEKNFANNPAWNGLRAVKNGNVHFLPQEYFLYAPVLEYEKAVEHIGKVVYPEVYKDGK